MCELLALNANRPTDCRFSFKGLIRRGGVTCDHTDGWGLASYEPDGSGVRIFREDEAAGFSSIAAHLAELNIISYSTIAHIRKATQGEVALSNCHPFYRRWRGEDLIFAHNGDLKGAVPKAIEYEPLGNTDSEAAFCALLGRLDLIVNPEFPSLEILFPLITEFCLEMHGLGTFNCLLSGGEWIFAFASTRLHCLTRSFPFSIAQLADADLTVDFSRETLEGDVVTVVSTEPLTSNEQWQQLQPGEALLLRQGTIFLRHLPA